LCGDGLGYTEVLHEPVCVNSLDLMAEFVVEVAGFEDELLVQDVLIDAEIQGTRSFSAQGCDVEGSESGLIAGLVQQSVEAGELGL